MNTIDAPRRLLLPYPPGCRTARFVLREKRFLVEAEAEGYRFRVHCNNSGSMLGLLKPGSEILVSPSANKKRRLPWTLEQVKIDHHLWAGVNTLVPNRMLHSAWKAGLLPEAAGYVSYRSESRSGESRLDALLEGPAGRLWVEAKNVTLVEEETAYFPDAVTTRGQKHLQELIGLARRGERTACFYLVQRSDALCFAPADFIDQAFSDLFRQAIEEGTEVWPYLAVLTPKGISLGERLPLQLR